MMRLSDIEAAVCEAMGVTPDELRGPVRQGYICKARHAYFWAAREIAKASLKETGKHCGGKHHTTVMHGAARWEAMMGDSEDIQAIAEAIKDLADIISKWREKQEFSLRKERAERQRVKAEMQAKTNRLDYLTQQHAREFAGRVGVGTLRWQMDQIAKARGVSFAEALAAEVSA